MGSNEKMRRLFRLERERIKIFAVNETGVKLLEEKRIYSWHTSL